MASRPTPHNTVSSEPTPEVSGGCLPCLPRTRQDDTITCYDIFGKPKRHGQEQRYVSPTTGVCSKLVIQAVHPGAKNECSISDHTGNLSELALWLHSTRLFHPRFFLQWIGVWLLVMLKLLFFFLWWLAEACAQLCGYTLPGNLWGNSDAYSTGEYKPYNRQFTGHLWAAHSAKEHSTRDEKERNTVRHLVHPRLLMIRDPTRDEWAPCTDPGIIMGEKYVAISYSATDAYTSGSNEHGGNGLVDEVRSAVVQMKFNAYWLDLECIGETPDERSQDVSCIADVYQGAESTLILLGNSREGEQAAWKRWGDRVWTLPEALLSPSLSYKFRDRNGIDSVSLHRLAKLAYPGDDLEQTIIIRCSGKHPLDRLERLSLLKSAIWRRGISEGSVPSPPPPPVGGSAIEKAPPTSSPYPAERVYALMCFCERRIQPNDAEDELRALVRLSMANSNDRIAERMVSLLPSTPHPKTCWYADDDVYDANIWDITPEIQVAGVTENGAVVLGGCRAASIRWKDFPQVALYKSNSLASQAIAFLPFFAWPIITAGIVVESVLQDKSDGIGLLAVGVVLLLLSPRLLVASETGRARDAQPWFIGVKGVLEDEVGMKHLYGGGNVGDYRRLGFTASGSEFAVPDRGSDVRVGSREQYEEAKKAEANGERVYTLVDTYASAVYYFRAKRAPTVCLFVGREGGLGRFVLCSERCDVGELHKETVLRMPMEVTQKMEMCGWLALG